MGALSILGLLLVLPAAACGIIILIAAFQEDITQGLLCFCVPFYGLYYGVARFEHEYKTVILAVWLGGGTVGGLLMQLGSGG